MGDAPFAARGSVCSRQWPDLDILERDGAALFKAAWDAFIVFTPPFDSMVAVLSDVYATAVERLATIDAGHFETEKPGVAALAERLKSAFGSVGVDVQYVE